MRLKVIVHQAEEGGYWAEVPALKGCYTQGETLDEIKENIQEAIELYLDEDVDPTQLEITDQVIEVNTDIKKGVLIELMKETGLTENDLYL